MSDKCKCSNPFWIPKGSEFKLNEDNSLSVIAPNGWNYVGYSNGVLKLAENGKTKISCTCNSEGTCDPFVANGAGGDSSSCSCSDGTCKLKKKSIGIGSAIWCAAGDCQGTCTLTTSIIRSGGIKFLTYQAKLFKY